MLAGRGGGQVVGGLADDAGRVGGRDLGLSALEELEEALGVLLLVLGRLEEDLGDLLVAAFLATLAK